MYFYVLCSLIDITNTGVLSYQSQQDNLRARNQHRNWQVLTQLLQLRTLPILVTAPQTSLVELSRYKFGSKFQGQHRVWYSVFAIEQEDLFVRNQNSTSTLEDDFDQIPMMTQLDETVHLVDNYLCTRGEYANIIFYTQNQWIDKDFEIDFEELKSQFENK